MNQDDWINQHVEGTLEDDGVTEHQHRDAAQIAAWLAVAYPESMLRFYTVAFGAVEDERLEGDDGKVEVARLHIGAASFWIQRDTSSESGSWSTGYPVRMVLSVADPDTLMARAIEAGAKVVVPIHEDHGWRSGRIIDPAGHDWEIGRPVG